MQFAAQQRSRATHHRMLSSKQLAELVQLVAMALRLSCVLKNLSGVHTSRLQFYPVVGTHRETSATTNNCVCFPVTQQPEPDFEIFGMNINSVHKCCSWHFLPASLSLPARAEGHHWNKQVKGCSLIKAGISHHGIAADNLAH